MPLLDLHCHTSDHSYDGQVPAADLVKELHRLGFAGVTLTDHAYLWPDEELAELRRTAGVPDEFALLSGQEVRTAHDGITYGDLLIYGATKSFPDDTSPLEIFAHLRQTGGFTIAPHPSLPRIGFGEHLGSFPVLAAECWNGRYGPRVAAESTRLANKHGMLAVGGSDTHRPEDIGGGGTEFPQMPKTLADIQRLLREGNARPWKPGEGGGIKGLFSRWRR